MIRPPGFRGAAFTTAVDGDVRHESRSSASEALGISTEWATVRQVHGSDLVVVSDAGPAGDADALATTTTGLPIAVFTADCGGVVLESDASVAVAHAGWRGVVDGVVAAAAAWFGQEPVRRAALGPMIGPCCFEVGDEVAAHFQDHLATTTWGTTSVDLAAAIQSQVPGAEWWVSDECTRCGDDYFSHRRDQTPNRMAAIGWLP